MLIRVHGLRELRINSETSHIGEASGFHFRAPSGCWFSGSSAATHGPKWFLRKSSFRESPPPRVPGQFQLGVRLIKDNALPSLTGVPMSMMPWYSSTFHRCSTIMLSILLTTVVK